jgi:NADH-quinone oxidoreductase subunit L
MFLACGVGAYTAGIFHLLTHAFFKALLFLAAGSVIHALSGEQDMRKIGGLRKHIPVTFWTMTMGVVAIAGIPPWAGFFSKDEILFQAFISPNPIGKLLWFVGLVTAGMTSFYMFRLWFKTFFGPEKFNQNAGTHDHGHTAHSHAPHESPWIMLFPLVILAILSVIGGWVGVPAALGGHNEIEHFLDPVFSTGSTEAVTATASHGLELILAAVSVLTALLGFYIAYLFYYKKRGTASALSKKSPALYRLVENKFYIDEIYSAFLVTPLLMFTRIFLGGLIDSVLVNGSGKAAGATTKGLSNLTSRIQSGNIRSYAGWLALGAAAVLLVMIFGRTLWMH